MVDLRINTRSLLLIPISSQSPSQIVTDIDAYASERKKEIIT